MLSVSAPAKINWLLFVLGKRDDGYHEILSLMQRVSLSDTLTLEKAGEITLRSALPLPVRDNLVWKAASLLKESTGYKGGARITLQKEVPAEAGLGGGSSDAAAALSGLNRLWGLGLGERELFALGAKLGSDVPFFLGPPAAVAGGRGDVIEKADCGKPVYLLLAKPPFGVSTSLAYRGVKGFHRLTKASEKIKIFLRALSEGDYSALDGAGGNDLEAGVLPANPEIARIKAALRQKGALYAAMSGSGSAVFGLFEKKEQAEKAASGMGWWHRVAETLC